MMHSLVYLAIPFHLLIKLVSLFLGQLGLPRNVLISPLHILCIAQTRYRMLRFSFTHELFEMNDGVRTALQEHFIVGHKHDGDSRVEDELLKPAYGLHI